MKNGVNIKTLNVSRNKLSMLGASVLRDYIESSTCPLVRITNTLHKDTIQ